MNRLCRIDPKLWAELEAWAQDELRSVNGQIDYRRSEVAGSCPYVSLRRSKGDGISGEADQLTVSEWIRSAIHATLQRRGFQIRTLPRGLNENTADTEFHNQCMRTAHGQHRTSSGNAKTGQ
jgi:hypothetical protein